MKLFESKHFQFGNLIYIALGWNFKRFALGFCIDRYSMSFDLGPFWLSFER